MVGSIRGHNHLPTGFSIRGNVSTKALLNQDLHEIARATKEVEKWDSLGKHDVMWLPHMSR